jgi:hypothetical protein
MSSRARLSGLLPAVPPDARFLTAGIAVAAAACFFLAAAGTAAGGFFLAAPDLLADGFFFAVAATAASGFFLAAERTAAAGFFLGAGLPALPLSSWQPRAPAPAPTAASSSCWASGEAEILGVGLGALGIWGFWRRFR